MGCSITEVSTQLAALLVCLAPDEGQSGQQLSATAQASWCQSSGTLFVVAALQIADASLVCWCLRGLPLAGDSSAHLPGLTSSCAQRSHLFLEVVQDRFQQLVPVLDKCGAATVGLTLLAIGVLGLLEARQQEEGIEQLQPITASGPTIPSGECDSTWRVTGI